MNSDVESTPKSSKGWKSPASYDSKLFAPSEKGCCARATAETASPRRAIPLANLASMVAVVDKGALGMEMVFRSHMGLGGYDGAAYRSHRVQHAPRGKEAPDGDNASTASVMSFLDAMYVAFASHVLTLVYWDPQTDGR